MKRVVAAGLAAFAVPILAVAASAQDGDPVLTATLVSVGGDTVGNVEIFAGPNGLLIRSTFDGIEPGVHGFHIHETGLCDAAPQVRPEDPPPFRSAGDHLNPGDKEHGFLNPAGPHAGDLPNIIMPEAGPITVDLFAAGLSAEMLMDEDGAAFIVHARADDYTSDSTGRSGGRIACGIIG
jgi:Cu-Zn family superoxide dismutase